MPSTIEKANIMHRDTIAKAAMVEASVPAAAYIAAEWLRQIVAVQANTWRHKDGSPPSSICLKFSNEGEKFFSLMCTLPPMRVPASNMIQLTT